MLFGHFKGVERAAGERAMAENQGAVRVDDVLFGSFRVAGGLYFLENVLVGEGTGLGDPSLRNPTTVRDAQSDSDIESSLISAGLTAGNYFFYHDRLSPAKNLQRDFNMFNIG